MGGAALNAPYATRTYNLVLIVILPCATDGVYVSITLPPWGGFPSTIARQPRGCQ